MLDKFIDQFAIAVAARASELIAPQMPKISAGPGRRKGSRVCPYPGCKNLGAGPRNRWFCPKHAKSVPVREQKRILAERAAKGGGASLVVKAGKRRSNSSMKGKKLDMSCRVAGCKNVSRGPRFGFMCARHLKALSPRQQREAREKWKTAHAKKAA